MHPLPSLAASLQPLWYDVEKLGALAYCRALEGVAIACKDVSAVLLAINEIPNWVLLGRHHHDDTVPLELTFCHDLNALLWHTFSNVTRWDLKLDSPLAGALKEAAVLPWLLLRAPNPC